MSLVPLYCLQLLDTKSQEEVEMTARPIVRIGSKSSKSKTHVKCTVVIRVGPGVDSIQYALQTCYESNVSNIYVVDDAYSTNSPLYQEQPVPDILTALKQNRVHIRYNNELVEEELQAEILVELPPDCYMVPGAFKKKIDEVQKNYKDYDIFAVAPQIILPFSIFNGLIFSLFMFDWFRALIQRFKLHQSTHVIFKVVNRKLGHAMLPKDKWLTAASRSSYSYGGSGTCLRPRKSGLSYFLYLCYSHSYIGIGSLVLFQLGYVLFVGFPFYNWIPIVDHYLQTRGGEVFTNARVLMWCCHTFLSFLMINKYFAAKRPNNALDQMHWVMALTIPLWLLPIFPLMLLYGLFLYRGYRAPPPPPSFKLPSVTKVDVDQKVEEDSDPE